MDKKITFKDGRQLAIDQGIMNAISVVILKGRNDYAVIEYANSESIDKVICLNEILYIN